MPRPIQDFRAKMYELVGSLEPDLLVAARRIAPVSDRRDAVQHAIATTLDELDKGSLLWVSLHEPHRSCAARSYAMVVMRRYCLKLAQDRNRTFSRMLHMSVHSSTRTIELHEQVGGVYRLLNEQEKIVARIEAMEIPTDQACCLLGCASPIELHRIKHAFKRRVRQLTKASVL